MVKKCILVVMMIALMIMMFVSCEVKPDYNMYSQIYDRYNKIESYKAEIEVTVNSNLTSKKYTVVQYYKSPDKYREDITAPDDVKGTKYVYSSGKVYLTPPYDANKTELNMPQDKNYMFLPDFFANYYKSEDTSITANRDIGGRQTALNTPITGNNIYRFSQSLWIDNKTCLPSKLETYDIKNKPIITVIYKDFKLNEKLEDNLFN